MLNELSKEIHDNAIAHGWWDEPRSFGEIIALCHSELSEALEEYRSNRPLVWFVCRPTDIFAGCNNMKHCKSETSKLGCTKIDKECPYKDGKPEGIAVELADCVIRILDYMAYKKEHIDDEIIPDSNIPDTFGEFITTCHIYLSLACLNNDVAEDMIKCISLIYGWAKKNNIDMDEIIHIKHEFNKTRSFRHGGKVI